MMDMFWQVSGVVFWIMMIVLSGLSIYYEVSAWWYVRKQKRDWKKAWEKRNSKY